MTMAARSSRVLISSASSVRGSRSRMHSVPRLKPSLVCRGMPAKDLIAGRALVEAVGVDLLGVRGEAGIQIRQTRDYPQVPRVGRSQSSRHLRVAGTDPSRGGSSNTTFGGGSSNTTFDRLVRSCDPTSTSLPRPIAGWNPVIPLSVV